MDTSDDLLMLKCTSIPTDSNEPQALALQSDPPDSVPTHAASYSEPVSFPSAVSVNGYYPHESAGAVTAHVLCRLCVTLGLALCKDTAIYGHQLQRPQLDASCLLQASGTPAKGAMDPESPFPRAPAASAPASCHCSPLQSVFESPAHQRHGPSQSGACPSHSADVRGARGDTAGTPERFHAARSSGSVAQVDTPMPASPGRGGAAPPFRSPDSPTVRFHAPSAATATQSSGRSAGLETLLDAAAAAIGLHDSNTGSAHGGEGFDLGPPVAAASEPGAEPAGTHMPGLAGTRLSSRYPGMNPLASADSGPRWPSRRPPCPPAVFSAQHLQPRLPAGGGTSASGVGGPVSTGSASAAAEIAEEVWDTFITDVAGAPGGVSGGHAGVDSWACFAANTASAMPCGPPLHCGNELAGVLDGAEDLLAMLLAGDAGDGGAEVAAEQQQRAGPVAAEAGSSRPAGVLLPLPEDSGSAPPLSPVREKRRRSPDHEEVAAAVPVYVDGGDISVCGSGAAAAARWGSDGLDQSIGACLRAISLPSVSSTAVSDLPTPAALGSAGARSGPFANVFGELEVEESSVWGEACSADVEEVSVRGHEPTLAHGLGSWCLGCSDAGGQGVRVVRHGAADRGWAQPGGSTAQMADVGMTDHGGEASPFGSVLQEDGAEAVHGGPGRGGGAGAMPKLGSMGGVDENGVGSRGQIGWMDNAELVREMLEQGLSLSG